MERSEHALREVDFDFPAVDASSASAEESYARRERNWGATLQGLIANPLFPRPGSAVLEVGCGTGVASLILAKLGYRVTGIDASSNSIEWAQERVKDVRLACGSAGFRTGRISEMNDLKIGAFDAVINGSGFHGLIGDERRLFLRHVYELLKPGGVFYLSTMASAPRDPLSAGVFDLRTRCQLVDGIPYRYFGRKEEILSELTQAGFSIAEFSSSEKPWSEQLCVLAHLTERD